MDKKDVFMKEVAPLLEDALVKCLQYRIPFFATCCYEDLEGQSSYRRYLVSPGSLGISLADDQIRRHINVSNGFDTIPQNQSFISNTFETFGQEDYGDEEIYENEQDEAIFNDYYEMNKESE